MMKLAPRKMKQMMLALQMKQMMLALRPWQSGASFV
jgi:hypothetical protein